MFLLGVGEYNWEICCGGSGGPCRPPVGPEQSRCGLNTLRQCLRLGLRPSLSGCPSEERGHEDDSFINMSQQSEDLSRR